MTDSTEQTPEPTNSDHIEVEHPEDALQAATLEDLGPRMRDAVSRAGWTKLMPVQANAIPYIQAGRDLMVQSRTGSGKTGAFLLPVLERIDPDRAVCQALVLVPTRELAQQVHDEVLKLAGDCGVRSVAVYGGTAYGPQLDAFKAGAHLVVGTPGRILDHLGRGAFELSHLQDLVFDEADRLLSMGFYPDMRKLREFLHGKPERANMFSATFPQSVHRLAREFLTEPEFLSLSSSSVHVAEVDHVCIQVPAMEKDRALIRVIEAENPSSAIVFCNTKANVHYVAVVLKRFGYDAEELSSDLSQKDREKVMDQVRKRGLRFLIATDVAARGIDIPELSHVFLYEVPDDPETYIHRSGRTGRAGAAGRAISLVAGTEYFMFDRIAKRYKIDVQTEEAPSDEDVANLVGQRVTHLLEAQSRERDKLAIERARRFLPLAKSLAEDEDENILVAMLLDDYYQQSLQDAPNLPTPRTPEEKQKAEEKSARPKSAPPARDKAGPGSRPRRRRRNNNR